MGGAPNSGRNPFSSGKRTRRANGYGATDGGRKRCTHEKELNLSVLLLALLVVIVLFVVGFAVVKFLIWVAIILAILWLIGFFVRGVEGARWYRW